MEEAHMFTRIMAVAAVSGLALTAALAPTTQPPAPSTAPSTRSPPAATAPSTTSPSASTTPATKSATANPAGKANFVTKQTSDQHLGSKFKGTDVIGTDDAKIGDVS